MRLDGLWQRGSTGGHRREFVFCEVFGFAGDAVSRLDTYHVWLA